MEINYFKLNNLRNWKFLYIISAFIGPGLGYGKLYFFHIILILTNLFLLIKLHEDSYKINFTSILSKYNIVFIFWFIWSLLGLLWSANVNETIKYLIYLLIGINCMFHVSSFISNERNFNKFLKIAKWILITNVFFAILESFGIFRWPLSPFSIHAPLFGRETENLNIGNLFLSGIYPPTGLFGNPNNLAVFCTVLMPFVISLTKGLLRNMSVISILWICLTTGSRGSLIALFIGLIFYIFFVKKNYNEIIIFLISFTLMLLALGIFTYKNDQNIITLFENVNLLNLFQGIDARNLSSSGIRLALIADGWEAFIKSKGIGLAGGGTLVFQAKLGGYGDGIVRLHNFWLEILFEGGIVLFFFIVLWFFSIFKKLLTIIKSNNKWESQFGKATLISLIIFIFNIVSLSTAIYFLPMWIFFGTLTGFIYRNENFNFIRYK